MSRQDQCPEHGQMRKQDTRYGVLWLCKKQGCTVRCWDGPTSLPGDQPTRDARHELHTLFDPLWKGGGGRFGSRGEAYRWLRGFMCVGKDKAHFGMFTLEQCAKAKAAIVEMTALAKG